MNVKIQKLHPNAIVPQYATAGAACFDLHALEGATLLPSNTFHTGLAFEIPQDHVMLVFSRSGHGFKNGIRLANCTGVIDADYRGEVMVRLVKDMPFGFDVAAGDRIAQAMIIPVEQAQFEVVEELSNTERGAGGFGSTGS